MRGIQQGSETQAAAKHRIHKQSQDIIQKMVMTTFSAIKELRSDPIAREIKRPKPAPRQATNHELALSMTKAVHAV